MIWALLYVNPAILDFDVILLDRQALKVLRVGEVSVTYIPTCGKCDMYLDGLCQQPGHRFCSFRVPPPVESLCCIRRFGRGAINAFLIFFCLISEFQ